MVAAIQTLDSMAAAAISNTHTASCEPLHGPHSGHDMAIGGTDSGGGSFIAVSNSSNDGSAMQPCSSASPQCFMLGSLHASDGRNYPGTAPAAVDVGSSAAKPECSDRAAVGTGRQQRSMQALPQDVATGADRAAGRLEGSNAASAAPGDILGTCVEHESSHRGVLEPDNQQHNVQALPQKITSGVDGTSDSPQLQAGNAAMQMQVQRMMSRAKQRVLEDHDELDAVTRHIQRLKQVCPCIIISVSGYWSACADWVIMYNLRMSMRHHRDTSSDSRRSVPMYELLQLHT